MDILLPIRPVYVSRMREGRKLVELRKAFPLGKAVDRVFVYASSPVQRICGFFVPREIVSLPPDELWERTKAFSCVGKDFFDAYFAGRTSGIGIFFDRFTPLAPVPIAAVMPRAPQNYAWLAPEQARVLTR